MGVYSTEPHLLSPPGDGASLPTLWFLVFHLRLACYMHLIENIDFFSISLVAIKQQKQASSHNWKNTAGVCWVNAISVVQCKWGHNVPSSCVCVCILTNLVVSPGMAVRSRVQAPSLLTSFRNCDHETSKKKCLKSLLLFLVMSVSLSFLYTNIYLKKNIYKYKNSTKTIGWVNCNLTFHLLPPSGKIKSILSASVIVCV